MKEEITYIAEDGVKFTDPLECVTYEFKNNPAILAKLEKDTSYMDFETKKRWCDSGACACLGCANHVFFQNKLTYYHWIVWKNNHIKQK